MAATSYPGPGFDRPAVLKSLLGSFWQAIYGAGAELDAQLRGLGALYGQAQRDLDEVIDAVAYATIPLAHVDAWRPVTIREVATTSAYAVRRYGDPGAAYGSAGDYGVPAAPATFPVPLAPAIGCALLCDAVVDPKRTLVAGVDFRVDDAGVAWLAADPFADPAFAPRPVFDADGVPVDRELTLWAWRATTDRRLLQQRLGSVLGLDLPSTAAGRDLAVALVEAVACGTSDRTLRRVFAALYDAPLCGSDGEVVEAVAYDRAGLMVATDAAVYRGPAAARPAVALGQVLAAGDPITDALRFDDLHAGAVPAGLAGLLVPPAWLGDDYQGGLAWPAAPAPVAAAAVPDAYVDPLAAAPPAATYAGPLAVAWPLGAAPADAGRFWARVYARGRAAAPDLAAALDVRTAPTTPARAANLPATVAPLAFLAANVLRGPTLVVRVRAGSAGPDRLDHLATPALRKAIPPHTLAYVQLEMPPVADNAGQPGAGVLAAPVPALPPLADAGGGWAPPTSATLAAVPAPAWSA